MLITLLDSSVIVGNSHDEEENTSGPDSETVSRARVSTSFPTHTPCPSLFQDPVLTHEPVPGLSELKRSKCDYRMYNSITCFEKHFHLIKRQKRTELPVRLSGQ